MNQKRPSRSSRNSKVPTPTYPMAFTALVTWSMSFFRWLRLTAGEGDSSMSFWWRRCTEQSRSPRQTTVPASSARTWTSMCRAG